MYRPQVSLDSLLYIAITFDAECDYFDNSFDTRATGSNPLPTFLGIEEGIPQLEALLDGYEDSYAKKLRSTWFVRVDMQIGRFFGKLEYLLDRYKMCWTRRMRHGDEIGFHPHIREHQGSNGGNRTSDAQDIDCLKRSYAAFIAAGFRARSSRMGEGFCSNALLGVLQDVGIRCDSTAMPGRMRIDGERNLDWRRAPQEPYFPSKADYRRPGEDAARLLQVPLSMVETQAAYDKTPLQRYVDLSFRHESVKRGLAKYLQTAGLLVTVTHPSALLPEIGRGGHGLISFDIEEFRRNLEFILTECHRLGRPYQFITIGDCWEVFGCNERNES